MASLSPGSPRGGGGTASRARRPSLRSRPRLSGPRLRNELRDYTVQLLRGSEVVRRYLDPAGVEALIAEHLARRANHNHTLWALINLTLWHRRFIEGA